MRYVWVDSGNDVDQATFIKHGITGAFFDIDDPRVTQKYLIQVRKLGLAVGVYVAWNWEPYVGLSGGGFADAVSERLDEIVPRTSGASFPKVQLNVELHDPKYIKDMLLRWRQIRPARDTSWTMEGMQAGWFGRDLIDKVINKVRVRIVPQCYQGDMTPQDVATVVKDLTDWGVTAAITPFRDALRIAPPPESGYYFTMGRLPR